MLTQDRPAIASVSLVESDRDPQGFANELGRSFEDYGFAIIADHGIPDELIHRAEEKAKAFFALPDEVKRRSHIPGEQPKWPPITADDYLQERLREIKLA